jgi:hypothetical protein
VKEPLTLTGLVETALAVRGARSVRQLSAFAQRHDQPITYTTLNHIRSGTYKSVPSAKTLRAIAWLAGVDEAVAFTAAGQPVPGPPLADDLPPGADNLSAKSRKAVIEMVRVLVDLESTNHEQQPADPRPGSHDAEPAAAVEDGPVAEQKTWPADQYDLAAHQGMPMMRDQIDRKMDAAGEENQEEGERH